ncbi:MAG TPA: host nuclease inhibitor protein [Gallionellaceae bacterium]|nr:host nuclease inhibitor protein [Gallionellaceae bacterium]
MIAYCYRSGQIRFGRKVPEGAIQVAVGPAKPLRELIRNVARHAYDGVTLLVPGIPEAASDEDAGDALQRFLVWIAPRVAEMQGGKS